MKVHSMKETDQAAELGTENVWRLLVQYAIPSVIAMTASSLYNITDSIFIGHGVGALALSGMAITFPLMNLAAAFGSLVGVGASRVNRVLRHAILLATRAMTTGILIGQLSPHAFAAS